jgi:hypothetical protein
MNDRAMGRGRTTRQIGVGLILGIGLGIAFGIAFDDWFLAMVTGLVTGVILFGGMNAKVSE